MYPSEIELIVDEPTPGHFYWLLQKQPEAARRPMVVDYAAGPMPTHSAAMMEGIAALQRRTEQRRHGGRVPIAAAHTGARHGRGALTLQP